LIKKIIIGSGILYGGYFLIKKLLPEFHAKYLELNFKSGDDVFLEKERVRAENEKKMRDVFERKLGTRNPEDYSQSELLKKMMFAPKLDFEKMSDKQKSDLAKSFEGIKWNPNNLDSYSGYKDWQPSF
jgi:hypothetical protein